MDGMPEEIDPLWHQGAEWLKKRGAEVVEISLPHTKYALPAYYIVAPAEASSNLARYDGVRYGLRGAGRRHHRDVREDPRRGLRRRGQAPHHDRHLRALGRLLRRLLHPRPQGPDADQARLREALERVDAILTPATPNAAFGLGEMAADPVQMYLNDVFTVTVNLAGLPGISVPGGLERKGLPLGLQLIGKPFDEETLFRVAHVIEEDAAFTERPQRWW